MLILGNVGGVEDDMSEHDGVENVVVEGDV